MMKTAGLYKQAKINYLPITDEEIDCGMFVRGVGSQAVGAGEAYPPQGHPTDYMFNPAVGRKLENPVLVYITHGKGVFATSDIPETNVNKGSMLFLFPHVWHTYHPNIGTGWVESWVSFSGQIFESYMNAITDKKKPVLEVGVNDRIVRMFSEMSTVAERQKDGFQHYLCGVLLHMLGVVHSVVKNRNYNNKDIECIQQARVIMLDNVSERVRPEQIAEVLNMSYSKFRKLFKQYTGIAPLQYILQLKIEKAKELLMHTEKSIKEISINLNFESTDYFSSFFHSKIGMSPHEYRTTHKVVDK